MDSAVTWLLVCGFVLYGCAKVMIAYAKASHYQEDKFEAYNRNCKAWWD